METLSNSKGKRYEMTDRWKAAVDERLRELGMTKADLARELKVTKAAISRLPAQNVSTLVPRICEVLDLQPPMVASTDDAAAAIAARVAGWSDEQKARAVELLDVIEKMIS